MRWKSRGIWHLLSLRLQEASLISLPTFDLLRNTRTSLAPRAGRAGIRAAQGAVPARPGLEGERKKRVQMPWNNHSGGGPRGQQPDLEGLLKRSREGLKQVIPGGAGPPGLLVFLGLLGAALLAAYFAFFFTVRANEVGVVLRFGKFDREVPSGLHVRLPFPIEEVKLARVTDQNIIEIGYESVRGASGGRDVATESLMLTGDEKSGVLGRPV